MFRSRSLKTSQKVVDMESRGGTGEGKRRLHMTVNYNPGLIALIREVRQLSALGFAIPRKIQETAAEASKYMKQAKALEKVSQG